MRRPALIPLLALAPLLVAVPAAPAATAGGGRHALGPDDSPISLRSVALGQRDADLTLAIRFRTRLDGAQLAPGKGRVCATFAQDGRESNLCLSRTAGGWRARTGNRLLRDAVIGRPSAGTITVRWRPDDTGLAAGAVRWHVAVTPADCPEPTAAPPADAPAQAAANSACRSRAPRTNATYAGRVFRAVVTGCRVGGSAQVSRGPSGKRIALTYDDGPSPYTPALLTTLKSFGVPATFFMIGQQVPGNAALVRRIQAEGHELANHSWNHANLGGGGPGATSQLAQTNAAIRQATGFTPCVFRPPYGATGANLVSRVRALGMTSILWSVDPNDWRTPGTGAIVSRVLAQTGPGAIILSHDGGGNRSQTLAAAPTIIRTLKARGYTFVTVSELLGYERRIELQR